MKFKMDLEMAHPSKTHEETTIESLPTETLSAILSYLPYDSHLVHTALVSKRFKPLVERLLYQRVTLYL